MKVLILAAGYGMRLYPYTKYFPKPLLELNHQPVIDYMLQKLSGLKGISKIVVVTNSRFFKHFQAWKNKSFFKNKINLVNDNSKSPKDKLGALADMFLGMKKEGFKDKEDCLVFGGDNFLEDRLQGFIDFAKSKAPCISIGLSRIRSRQEGRHYGIAVLNKAKQIIDFKEKPACPKSNLAAMCLYYFPAQKLKLIKKSIGNCRLRLDNIGSYIAWLVKNDTLYGFIFKKMWFDIGRIQTYRKLDRILKSRSK